jgi:hypothetical protein
MTRLTRQTVFLAVASLGMVAWILQTAMNDPIGAVMHVGLIYLTVRLTLRYLTPYSVHSAP